MSLTKVSYSMINGAPLSPKDFGAVGDGVANDAAAFNLALAQSDKTIDLGGGTYRVASQVDITGNRTVLMNGTIILDGVYMKARGVQGNKFINVNFRGLQIATNADFTGSYLDVHPTPPVVFSNGDGYINTTTRMPYVAIGGQWVAGYKNAGVWLDTTTPVVTDGQSFENCSFTYLSAGILFDADRDTTSNLKITGGCTFTSCAIGFHVKNPKRIVVSGANFFADCIYGILSETANFEGQGLNIVGNFFNGNYYAVKTENGLYDSVISDNSFDHNSYSTLFGGDIPNGTGLWMVGANGRFYRGIVITGNACRNNGNYSIILEHNHPTGEFAYLNVSNNLAHLDDIANLLIYDTKPTGAFYLGLFGNNNFTNGISILGTFDPALNAIHSIYQGGNIAGKTDFDIGLTLDPRNNVYTTTEGFLQYSSTYQGTTAVTRRYSGALEQLRFQVADYATTAEITALTRTVRVGEMIFNSTLNKPLWRGIGGWVDATGAIVIAVP